MILGSRVITVMISILSFTIKNRSEEKLKDYLKEKSASIWKIGNSFIKRKNYGFRYASA